MKDILDDLRDLEKQATTERSHYYVRECCRRAIAEIESLRHQWAAGVSEVLRQIKKNKIILDDATEKLDRRHGPHRLDRTSL